MRIAFISPFIYRYWRGIERFTVRLSNVLAKTDRDMRITILTWQEKSPKGIDGLADRVEIHNVPYFRYYRSIAAIPFYAADLLRNRYDVVNIFFAGYGEAEALRFLRLTRRQKFNIIFQYPYSHAPHQYIEFQKSALIDKADCVISPSKFVAEEIEKFCGKKSKIIYNGVDCDNFYSDGELRKKTRSALCISEGDRVILTISALEERKGIQKVIRVLPILGKKVKNVKYVIVGEGPYEPQLKNLTKDMGMEEQVVFVGGKENIQPFYCMADLFVLLSYGEGMPLAVLSAMASWLPVIASKQKPFDEIIKDGAGYLVDDTDPEAISEAISNLFMNDSLREKMRQSARACVVDNFDINKTALQYRQLFRSQAQ